MDERDTTSKRGLVGRRQAWTLLGALAATACSRARASIPGPARRVVSISPNTTETLFAIGAGDALVGRSRYCDFPPEALARPAVGGWIDPNLEAILALAPDLVVGARGPGGQALVGRLEQRGIATYFPEVQSLAQIDELVIGLGERVGRRAESEQLVAKMRADRASLAKALASPPRRRALLVFGLSPIYVAGPGSFEDELLALAGGDNPLRSAAGGRAAAYPTIDIEQVIAMDPDVVLDAAFGEHRSDGGMGPAWQSVRAVREGRVVRLSDPVVLRPGPRIAEGLRQIARALHPGESP